VEDRSPIEFWTEQDGGGEVGTGSWRAADGWPEAGGTSDSVALALSPDGLVRSDAFTDGVVDTEYTFDQTVGIDSIDFLAPPADTNSDDARSLLFETAPLSDPVEWTGTGRAKLRVTPSVEDHLLAVRVVDVSTDRDASLVSYGRVRASQRESYTDPDPPIPGEEYTVEVPLKPKSHIFERGHRLRVAISAAYFPLMLAPRHQGSFTVTSEPGEQSVVEFPGRVHDGEVAFDDRIEQDPPEDDVVPVASEYLTVTRSDWKTAREHTDDEASLTAVTDRTIQLPHGATMSWEREVEASVRADEPLTSTAYSETSVEVDYGTEVVRVDTTSRVGHDTASIAVRVRFDDQVMYDENWRWTR
jgi:predicted acyl esterase